MESKEHWERVYGSKSATSVSWYQQHASASLRLIRTSGLSHSASIIDVGGGASTLVDDLLAEGFEKLTVLDISASALATARARLGDSAARVHWMEANVLDVHLPAGAFDLWHDRAVFHFLTSAADRSVYVRQIAHSVVPGGSVVIATFAEDGPIQCSGLAVVRYSVEGLEAALGERFRLLDHEREVHLTPSGNPQRFIYCRFARLAE